MTRFAGPGIQSTLQQLTSNRFTLQAGGVWLPPPGSYNVALGRYTTLEFYDPIANLWYPETPASFSGSIYCDGFNMRFANTSGCVAGAVITNAGSGYLSAPTVTASAGGSTWTAIVGGAVNTSITVSNGGTNYTYAPFVVFSPPPAGGLQATGFATISAGVVTSVTVTNQGAGYNSAPTINFFNDPRDTTGANASAVAVLTGSQTITGLVCTNHGTPQTTVPTLTFAGGSGSSAAATVLMNLACTGYTVTTAGAGYTAAAGGVIFSPIPNVAAATPIYTNTASQIGITKQRSAQIFAPTNGSGAITATGLLVIDGGSYQSAPGAGSLSIIGGTGVISTAAVLVPTYGGLTDPDNYIYPQ